MVPALLWRMIIMVYDYLGLWVPQTADLSFVMVYIQSFTTAGSQTQFKKCLEPSPSP